MDNAIIVLAGATGNLGRRIARAILAKGGSVKAIVRHNSDPNKVEDLRKRGAVIAEVDFNSLSKVTGACMGGSCVISALSGLRDVIVETQTLLLDAAVKAGVYVVSESGTNWAFVVMDTLKAMLLLPGGSIIIPSDF